MPRVHLRRRERAQQLRIRRDQLQQRLQSTSLCCSVVPEHRRDQLDSCAIHRRPQSRARKRPLDQFERPRAIALGRTMLDRP
jgi:hypothetical protein